MTPQEEKKWKKSLSLHKYEDRFELAKYRTAKMGLSPIEMSKVPTTYWKDETVKGFLNFINLHYQPLLEMGLSRTCIAIHSGLVDAVEEYFSCRAVLTIGSITTPKGELYKLDEGLLGKWISEGVNLFKVNLHAWITLDSMEIFDMTFLPTIAEVSRNQEIANKLPVAVYPDSLMTDISKEDKDPFCFPKRLKYSPFICGKEILSKIGLTEVQIHKN